MAKAVVPSSIVFEVLEKDNYEEWSETIQSYLEFKDLWDVVESNEQPPDRDTAWKKKNSEALHAIQISCGRDFLCKIRGIREANKAWRTLEANFNAPLPGRMENTVNPPQGDEENVDDEYQKAYKTLADALSKRNISQAIELCKKNAALLKERLPDYTPLLHQLIMLVSNLSEDELVKMLKLDYFPKEAVEMTDSFGSTPSSFWTLDDCKYGATLITKCFDERKFEFASKFLKEYPQLIFAKDVNGLSPLYLAASAPHLFGTHEVDSPTALSPYSFKFPKFPYYCKNKSIISLWRQESRTLRGRRPLGVTGRLIVISNAIRDSKMPFDHLRDALFEAIKCGNFNFILMLIHCDENILEKANDMSKNIYMCAIEYRQPKVFSLIFWNKKIVNTNVLQDKWKNNLLHMAATWRPPNALRVISKPALLMISEAMWFAEVLDLAPDLEKKANIRGKIPYDLFKESHEDLMMKAEKEMKESAASWAIVGPLIITIMFAAAFQIPGGYNQEIGFPIFLNKTCFKVYMVLVSISLISATNSVASALEILSSDHHKKDFLISLRSYVKTYSMITGNLFWSLAFMLVAFCLGLFLTLHGDLAFFLPIAVAATSFVVATAIKNFALLVDSVPFYERKKSLFEKDISDEVDRFLRKLRQLDGRQPTQEVAT